MVCLARIGTCSSTAAALHSFPGCFSRNSVAEEAAASVVVAEDAAAELRARLEASETAAQAAQQDAHECRQRVRPRQSQNYS